MSERVGFERAIALGKLARAQERAAPPYWIRGVRELQSLTEALQCSRAERRHRRVRMTRAQLEARRSELEGWLAENPPPD